MSEKEKQVKTMDDVANALMRLFHLVNSGKIKNIKGNLEISGDVHTHLGLIPEAVLQQTNSSTLKEITKQIKQELERRGDID